mgnify:CR=1 FL=1
MVNCDLCHRKLDERGPWDWHERNFYDLIVCLDCESSNTPEELEESLIKLRREYEVNQSRGEQPQDS